MKNLLSISLSSSFSTPTKNKRVAIVGVIVILILWNFVYGIGVVQRKFYNNNTPTTGVILPISNSSTLSSVELLLLNYNDNSSLLSSQSNNSSAISIIKSTRAATTSTNTANNTNTDSDHHQSASSPSSTSSSSLKLKIIDSKIVDWDDLLFEDKACGVWKCFIPIKKGSNLSSLLLEGEINHVNDIDDIDIGWLSMLDGTYSANGSIVRSDAMYKTWELYETLRLKYGIPHLMLGPPKFLIDLTVEQRQAINSKKKSNKKKPVTNINLSSSNRNTIVAANTTIKPPPPPPLSSLIIQPIKQKPEEKGSSLWMRRSTTARSVTKFCNNANINITRLKEDLHIQHQLLEEYPLLAMDYQTLLLDPAATKATSMLLMSSSSSSLSSNNNKTDDNDRDDTSESSSFAKAIVYNVDLDRYYQYYEEYVNNTKKLNKQKTSVQSWLESLIHNI